MNIILASASARRRELLSWLQIPFEAAISDFDEASVTEDDPEELVSSLALAKAQTVANRFSESLIIGADTMVAINDELIGKPKDRADAKRILNLLRSYPHQVYTGVATINTDTHQNRVEVETSTVTFKALSDKALEDYLDTNEWQGKAGGYQLTGLASNLVSDIIGSATNVVGLPLLVVADMLESEGIVIPVDIKQVIIDKSGYTS